MAAKDSASSLSATIRLRPTKGNPKASSSLTLPLPKERSSEETMKRNFWRAKNELRNGYTSVDRFK